jgi:hypothetical protein
MKYEYHSTLKPSTDDVEFFYRIIFKNKKLNFFPSNHFFLEKILFLIEKKTRLIKIKKIRSNYNAKSRHKKIHHQKDDQKSWCKNHEEDNEKEIAYRLASEIKAGNNPPLFLINISEFPCRFNHVS